MESRSKREEPETVYNIEVEGDHCYRVGESGIFVHNASCPNEILALGGACALFPESFTGKKYLGFDGQGRAKGVQARLCKGNQSGGSIPSDKQEDLPKGWEEAGQLLTNRGIVAVRAHLLSEALGGPGVQKNLAATCKGVNNKLYNNFEKTVIEWVDGGVTVNLEVTVEYSGNSPYPKLFKVKASRLDCQRSTADKPVCDVIQPSGGILAEIDITNCPGAIKR